MLAESDIGVGGLTSGRARFHAWVLLGCVCFAEGGCVYDGDEPCGGNQILNRDYLRCVCAPGFAQTVAGCVACGDNEVADSQGCTCAPGFARPTPEAACEAAPTGLGEACDEATACQDPAYDHCETSANGSRYCTNTGCVAAEDCQGGYACDTSVQPSVCRRPPLGQGQPCQTSEDCANTEATYCDAFATHSCRVEGCTLSPDNCFMGSECCDLSAFNVPQPICVVRGACP